MTEPVSTPPPGERRPPLVDWLRAANTQVAGWAASLSWWRLILLFLLILMAGAMVSDQLRLKHDYVRVPATDRKERVVVTIGGKDGIRITERGTEIGPQAAPGAGRPPAPGADPDNPNPNPLPRKDGANNNNNNNNNNDNDNNDPDVDPDADDEKLRTVQQRVWTFRGLLGDLGATVLIVLFAYLAAAKIIVRKVAQADEKVRSAEDAAGREAMERQLVQAQLQVLQAQVEPHFLFNTLATVDYLIETDPARASLMQKKLITYLRGALPQMRQESSTLGRELRLIRSYLDLIKMRIEERLEVEFEVPAALEPAAFPPMMLQSLVENAIKHGIEPKPEGGKVTVGARLQRGTLWVEVRDTGVGVLDTERLESPTSGGGLGLQNIRERLVMLYGGKGRLTLMSDDRMGTVVRIGVPYKLSEEAVGAQATADADARAQAGPGQEQAA